ncbi:MAG: flagellar basal body P-ring protein FlgI [Pseudomonadales bacterium]|nr:flagellar basal body P-ring protein FlgI [Pseudomonadales bacterium]
MKLVFLLLMVLAALVSVNAEAMRIKDMTTISGVRDNELLGYGLVIGLDGTGDQTAQTFFTEQSMKNLLNRLGVVIPPGISLQLKNVAAVMVQATLPPFAKQGQAIDVTVSSIGNAKSLRGGALIMTPLKGTDGQVYAVAQGNLIVGGFGAEGANGSSVSVNSTATGRIPDGASVERTVDSPFAYAPTLQLNLNDPDFTTARRLADRINEFIGSSIAMPIDSVSINVQVPQDFAQKVAFVSELENLEFEPGEAAARIIINSRTGTVVIGNHVRVMPAAVSHGSLTVSVSESASVSQPAPLSKRGNTVVVPESDVKISQDKNPMFLFQPGVSLDELVQAVNAVGAAPGDLVSILEALKEVGALQAQLIVI